MGKGDGVMLEADVGFKDGEKSVFSPHGLDDEKEGSSHVDEDPQVFSIPACFSLNFSARASSQAFGVVQDLADLLLTKGREFRRVTGCDGCQEDCRT